MPNPQFEKLEKLVAWPGIEPGSPAVMASALTTETIKPRQINSETLLYWFVQCFLKGPLSESESGSRINIFAGPVYEVHGS